MKALICFFLTVTLAQSLQSELPTSSESSSTDCSLSCPFNYVADYENCQCVCPISEKFCSSNEFFSGCECIHYDCFESCPSGTVRAQGPACECVPGSSETSYSNPSSYSIPTATTECILSCPLGNFTADYGECDCLCHNSAESCAANGNFSVFDEHRCECRYLDCDEPCPPETILVACGVCISTSEPTEEPFPTNYCEPCPPGNFTQDVQTCRCICHQSHNSCRKDEFFLRERCECVRPSQPSCENSCPPGTAPAGPCGDCVPISTEEPLSSEEPFSSGEPSRICEACPPNFEQDKNCHCLCHLSAYSCSEYELFSEERCECLEASDSGCQTM